MKYQIIYLFILLLILGCSENKFKNFEGEYKLMQSESYPDVVVVIEGEMKIKSDNGNYLYDYNFAFYTPQQGWHNREKETGKLTLKKETDSVLYFNCNNEKDYFIEYHFLNNAERQENLFLGKNGYNETLRFYRKPPEKISSETKKVEIPTLTIADCVGLYEGPSMSGIGTATLDIGYDYYILNDAAFSANSSHGNVSIREDGYKSYVITLHYQGQRIADYHVRRKSDGTVIGLSYLGKNWNKIN